MTDPRADGDSGYVIRTGSAAVARLELIARLFWPTTEALLTRVGALDVPRFLDVGCGIGDVASRVSERGVAAVGVDVNTEVVAAATARAARHGSSATFAVAGVDDLSADPAFAGVDVVFARCLVSHLQDPAAALAAMVAVTRPGGRIVVEDVEVAAIWASPPCAALARHVELYVAAATGLGARPDIGAHLAPLLRDLGATEVEVNLVQPVLREPADLRAHARTMEAIAGPVVAQGLATDAEVADLVARLDAWADEPGVVATLPRIVQVTARAP